MSISPGNTTRAKTAKLKKRIRQLLGHRCIWCNTNRDVQMAHVKPTELSGKRSIHRGQWERCNDVVKHPNCYRKIGRAHHALFDALTGDLMQAALRVKEEPIPF